MAGLRFDGRVVIVTGGGRGLGRAHAELLGSLGARVVVNDPGFDRGGTTAEEDAAGEVVAAIRAAGGEAVACRESVASPEGGRAIIEAALDGFGRLDAVVHSAGNTRRARFAEMSIEDYHAVLDVHLHGAVHVCQPAFRHMANAGFGRIVVTSSIAGLYGEPSVPNYSIAKAGQIGLVNVLALEGKDCNVRANAFLPAAVTRLADARDTTAYPPLEPERVAPMVAWLAHEACSISGEMLVALGGRMARAWVSESRGLFDDAWTIDKVHARLGVIREDVDPLVFPVVPSGFVDHLSFSFAMAREERAAGVAEPADG